MKKTIALLAVVLVSMPVLAHSDHEDFSDISDLIENPADCSQLTEAQLERIGDYFMEQMHPGEAHERMDAMMGGEGSENLKQMHVSMALRFYCQGQDTTETVDAYPHGMMWPGMGMFRTDNGQDTMHNGFMGPWMMQGYGSMMFEMPHFAMTAGFAQPFGIFAMMPFFGFV